MWQTVGKWLVILKALIRELAPRATQVRWARGGNTLDCGYSANLLNKCTPQFCAVNIDIPSAVNCPGLSVVVDISCQLSTNSDVDSDSDIDICNLCSVLRTLLIRAPS